MTDEGKRYVDLADELNAPRYAVVAGEMDRIWWRLSELECEEINGLLTAIDEVERTGKAIHQRTRQRTMNDQTNRSKPVTFKSEIREVGRVAFPAYQGTRIMMMPFHLHDVAGTLPDEIARWRVVIDEIVAMGPVHRGTAYLTIDEAAISRGETHRRPGLHVDGVGPRGDAGGWGGGGGYGSNGMLMTSTHVGCAAWDQTFEGWPGPDGDCAHLDAQIRDDRACVLLQPGVVYHCGPMTVHEAVPMTEDCRRSFVRVSMPSNAPWYEGYTENPTGVLPAGPIHPRRVAQMAYRP